MLVLLPPSETKRPDGTGGPLDLEQLSWPQLTPLRTRLAGVLGALSSDPPAARAALGLSERQDDELGRNAALLTSPTLPALDRYTGVLYDALDVATLTRAQRRRAEVRLVVGSALFGLVRGEDRVPAYRLSAGSLLPGLPPLRALWRPLLSPLLAAAEGLVLDLRSAAYAALGPVPGAVTVRVETEAADGSRTVVSHASKAHKGRLARALVTTASEPADVVRLRALLRRAGWRLEHDGGSQLTVVV